VLQLNMDAAPMVLLRELILKVQNVVVNPQNTVVVLMELQQLPMNIILIVVVLKQHLGVVKITTL